MWSGDWDFLVLAFYACKIGPCWCIENFLFGSFFNRFISSWGFLGLVCMFDSTKRCLKWAKSSVIHTIVFF